MDTAGALYGGSLEYRGITLLVPSPIFTDVSSPRDKLLDSIQRLQLADLILMVNEHMHAVVQCPWGCTDYYHKANKFCMMSVYHQYLGLSLVTLGKMKSQALSSIRDDYITVKDWVLFNLAWEIVPSIAFIADTGPTVLVYRTHGSGSNVKYIHPPLHPGGNVPAARADQMAQVVVVP